MCKMLQKLFTIIQIIWKLLVAEILLEFKSFSGIFLAMKTTGKWSLVRISVRQSKVILIDLICKNNWSNDSIKWNSIFQPHSNYIISK